MKQSIIKNTVFFFIIILLDLGSLFIEGSIKESTAELLAVIFFLFFLIGLIILNLNTFKNIQQKFRRIAFTSLLVTSIFIGGFATLYFLNWYVFIPAIY
jgi:membrane-bound ClpP family serine protease